MKKKENKAPVKEPSLVISPLEEIMGERFGRYSKYIIQERALPDARDGLKPVQRRILYAMYHDGNTFDHQHRKSAKTVGLVIGNYHPHGDSSVYDAMVRMSQDWKIRMPLIDMHGNNGSIDDDPAAAMRYTEARLAKIAGTLLEDIDKDTVLFAPNFDDTENEPTVLPARFPVLLVNGATGIAAGYATNIPPHNLSEVIDAAILRMQRPKCTLEELMEILPGPDFPTGGIVMGKKGITDAFTTGKGRIVIRARTEIVTGKTCNQIVIREIPYEVIKSSMVRKMDDIRLSREIEGIMDIRDETDRTGLRIVIDVKKDIDPNIILNYFYKNTDLQIYYSYNMVSIVNKRPVQMGLIGMLDAFIAHREEVVLRRSRYLYNKMEERCHILEGLMKAVSIMDEVIAVIRQSKDKGDAKRNLMDSFQFSETQAEAIVTLRLYRLTSTDIVALREEFAQLVNEMEMLKTILESETVLKSVLIKELKEIKKEYADPRRSEIQEEVEEIVIDKTAMIPNERVMITVSRDGYVKRVSLRSYGASDHAMTGLKEGDLLVGQLEVDTLDTLLLFTSKGNYAYLPVYQIDEAKWKDIGSHLNKYVSIDGDDKIINAILVKNFSSYAWIVTASRRGQVKKTPISQWQVQRNNKMMTAMNLKKDDAMIRAFVVYAHEDLIMISRSGWISRYSSDLVPSTGTKSQGVKALNLAKDDSLAAACSYGDERQSLWVLSDKGNMKRVKMSDVSITARPVKGEIVVKRLKANPYHIAYCQCVQPYDSLILMDPQVQILQAKDVPMMSREATFSTPLELKPEWGLIKGIEEVRIVDHPVGEDEIPFEDYEENENEKVHSDVEMMSLFEEE
ncbi:DNA topoisomerase IV subunit A [Holdemania massiliensis]|uniref:DNA topoisomerase 4 subunit A n=1 Tax=Holdemania massiliensis TaxID=1468449 RepID=A0A6N7SBW9_9FIRM|nr:DNA topoisomerase IV subunit A [Holdemania massiliensis]MSA72510.1 DNA topoisomerase IV subunit A [Holdemania massiliensis]MSA90786.1 DNA topoisomerase IV subunit A [Holdemania massiliensis]MSB79561.1 DNA topoisomerase IV subunit A [Holdemania massiliensis]MSC34516.1 DNA topoisomerase IV subunit A [Holdemania massiliensis]MSC40906.1 DNA topoisomerase IV subunit A [Holdemania massiliensis]